MTVFSGVVLAFVVIDDVSIILAGSVGKRLPTSEDEKISAIMFIVLGILTFLELL